MRVPRAAITSACGKDSPRMSPVRRILREAGLEVLRPARQLPRVWQRFVRSKCFPRSRPWSRLRYDFLRDQHGRCQLCGHGAQDGARLNVDHILARKTHPQLALAYANLQLLCSQCNAGKGNRDGSDWRFQARDSRDAMAQPVVRSATRPPKGIRTRPHRRADRGIVRRKSVQKPVSPRRQPKCHWAQRRWRHKG